MVDTSSTLTNRDQEALATPVAAPGAMQKLWDEAAAKTREVDA